MGARRERKGVSDDQKLSTNGGFWTLLSRFTVINSLLDFTLQFRPSLNLWTEAEENEYSRKAFYNLVLFISSVAIFSLTAQRMSGPKAGR
ncbi:uncharacterized protein N7500_009918 [Penicillium coprophilum]|uniref:uncharacterized protein n=1 Tax=Penicillium coprophilum TaxID=36646 RepID=UPI00238C592D|nr:uncharacterized protein N7500_009918 [Penicillium coprophilum]KAJ5154479.1 hypothetical protein N7500_009918 [Penicillium coprophilum]